MESIYVLEPGSYLRKEGNALLAVKERSIVDRIPCEGLQRLMLIGYVSLSGAVLDFLIKRRVETVFVTPTGRFRARLGLDEHKHVALRKAQYLCLSNPAFALKTARQIVQGKVANMHQFLLLRARQKKNEAIGIAAARLKQMGRSTKDVESMDGLRGIEGAATRTYFEVFNQLIGNPRFEFRGRNRRPPLDPVNALLSFVYTLLTNEVLSAVKTVGLDPYLGSLHDISYGRPSLACDLVEEYRCFLGDRMVLGIINRKAIEPDDFVYRARPPDGFVDETEMRRKRPVEMKPAVCRAFIATYEEMMKRTVSYPPLGKSVSYRWLIVQQAQAFGRVVEDPDKAYVPYVWKI